MSEEEIEKILELKRNIIRIELQLIESKYRKLEQVGIF